MPRPKQRTSALRQRVLVAAIERLSREGAAALTARGVATSADTSTSAVYELFGDKSGLVREIFFEGFRQLGAQLAAVERNPDPRADLLDLMSGYRSFVLAHPRLADVMFSRPFAAFDPSEEERAAGAEVRELIVARVQVAVDQGVLVGDATDIAHVIVSMTQGLAAAELANRLGGSKRSVERRWRLALAAVLDGLSVRSG